MKHWLKSTDTKCAVNLATGGVVAGFDRHAEALGVRGFDSWIRAIIFPSRKRVYFRFYKPDGDYCFIDERDKAKSFDACYSAWEILVKRGYCPKSWKVLYATTDKLVTHTDIKF